MSHQTQVNAAMEQKESETIDDYSYPLWPPCPPFGRSRNLAKGKSKSSNIWKRRIVDWNEHQADNPSNFSSSLAKRT